MKYFNGTRATFVGTTSIFYRNDDILPGYIRTDGEVRHFKKDYVYGNDT